MLAFTIVDAAIVAAISFLVWQYEQRKKSVVGPTDESSRANNRQDISRGGGAEPTLTNAYEMELIKRSVPLPDRSEPPYSTDPALYHAELKRLCDSTFTLSDSLQPQAPEKFEVAVPASARTVGHVLLDMVQFQRPRDDPQPPPPWEHMDF